MVCVVLNFIIKLVVVQWEQGLVKLFGIICSVVNVKFISLDQLIENWARRGGVFKLDIIDIGYYLIVVIFFVDLQEDLVEVIMLSGWGRIWRQVDVIVICKVKGDCLLFICQDRFDDFVLCRLGCWQIVILQFQ